MAKPPFPLQRLQDLFFFFFFLFFFFVDWCADGRHLWQDRALPPCSIVVVVVVRLIDRPRCRASPSASRSAGPPEPRPYRRGSPVPPGGATLPPPVPRSRRTSTRFPPPALPPESLLRRPLLRRYPHLLLWVSQLAGRNSVTSRGVCNLENLKMPARVER